MRSSEASPSIHTFLVAAGCLLGRALMQKEVAKVSIAVSLVPRANTLTRYIYDCNDFDQPSLPACAVQNMVDHICDKGSFHETGVPHAE